MEAKQGLFLPELGATERNAHLTMFFMFILLTLSCTIVEHRDLIYTAVYGYSTHLLGCLN